MAWYDFWNRGDKVEKLNPAQEEIVVSLEGAGPIGSRELPMKYTAYYEYLEVVNRGVNMIVDDAAEIPLYIGEPIKGAKPVTQGENVRRKKVDLLLNKEPNPFQDISSFRRNLIIDYILDGNIFIYFDGSALYHIPANHMDIIPDTKTYVTGYTFQKSTNFSPDEIIHIKENSFNSIYRGTSRLRAARNTLAKLVNMLSFQDNFFKNGAVTGLVIKSPDIISEKNKERMIQSWMTKYSPTGGGRRPLILDGGMTLDSLSSINFKELDFEQSIDAAEKKIMKVLGVPPVLMDSGNNANIRPNHRLYYLETVLPIVTKINIALERFFGYEITPNVTNIPALQPELRDAGSYYTTLVNSGIITPNEARHELNFDKMVDHNCDEIRIPQNIAGSAVDASQGGRPPGETNADEE